MQHRTPESYENEIRILREAVYKLIEASETSNDCQYGTLSTSFVCDILNEALSLPHDTSALDAMVKERDSLQADYDRLAEALETKKRWSARVHHALQKVSEIDCVDDLWKTQEMLNQLPMKPK
jgi:hypothetical protein